jgi:DNA integrity scanning protein DisA with diadenylate cyclase activity
MENPQLLLMDEPTEGLAPLLVKAIEAPVRKYITTSAPVTSVRRKGKGFVVQAGGKETGADRVVSSIPLPALLPCLNDVPPDVLAPVVRIAIEIAREGREGQAIGTSFVVGDTQNVMKHSKQFVLNPFHVIMKPINR